MPPGPSPFVSHSTLVGIDGDRSVGLANGARQWLGPDGEAGGDHEDDQRDAGNRCGQRDRVARSQLWRATIDGEGGLQSDQRGGLDGTRHERRASGQGRPTSAGASTSKPSIGEPGNQGRARRQALPALPPSTARRRVRRRAPTRSRRGPASDVSTSTIEHRADTDDVIGLGHPEVEAEDGRRRPPGHDGRSRRRVPRRGRRVRPPPTPLRPRSEPTPAPAR